MFCCRLLTYCHSFKSNHTQCSINQNSPVSDATNQTFTPTSNGSYAVEITQNGCSVTSDCVDITGIGIVEFESSENHITIYPNPFSTSTTIKTGSLLKNASLII
jgi:hypothetical protein